MLPRRGLHNESLVPSDRSPTASKAQVAMVERPSVYASALVLKLSYLFPFILLLGK